MTDLNKGLRRIRRREERKAGKVSPVSPRELHNESETPPPDTWQREATFPFDYQDDETKDTPKSDR